MKEGLPARVFSALHAQRIIVLDPLGRWLGLIRARLSGVAGAQTPANTAQALRRHDCPGRAVVPALNLDDALSMAMRLERSVVLVDMAAGRMIAETRSVAAMNWPVSVMLLASSMECRPAEELFLLEGGFDALVRSVAEVDRVIRLAAGHFSGQWPVQPKWPEGLVSRLPWPKQASAIEWASVFG